MAASNQRRTAHKFPRHHHCPAKHLLHNALSDGLTVITDNLIADSARKIAAQEMRSLVS